MTRTLSITRRDFVNGVLAGSGAALLSRAPPLAAAGALPAHPFAAPGPGWYGYGGVGDYAESHGNTPEVVARAHEIRDGRYTPLPRDVHDTGEVYDAVIVGGGIAGLGAALEFRDRAGAGRTCLLLDNHPIWGGESKRNEFIVDGQRLMAPQGANGFSIPGVDEGEHASDDGRYYDALGIPREFRYPHWDPKHKPLRFANDHYGYLYWIEHGADVGYFDGGAPAVNPWARDLEGTAWSAREREDLLRWRRDTRRWYDGADFERWLDTMSYGQFVERVMGLGRHVSDYASPILAGAVGLGADAVSAYAAYAILMPGTINFYPPAVRDFSGFQRHSFPGGNDGFARHFVKKVLPGAIAGGDSFGEIMNGAVQFDRLDLDGLPVRMRLAATVVAVEHAGDPAGADLVDVTYHRDGRLQRVHARGVVMAGGGWVNRHVVRDLPGSHRSAYATFRHAPFLVANVAVRQWRFLYDLGISACRYRGDFGYCVNVRAPMHVGDYRPRLDPDAPAVLSFYVPFTYPGEPTLAQCSRGRAELFSTSYADYERRIITQLRSLFGTAFNPRRDVAGIILNRWGHAYVVPEPGFYFGRDGQPAARDVVRERHGRIAFGHSELRGNQHWGPAAAEGARAMAQVLEVM
jgi:spermidine dehydrogenase